MLIVFYVHLGPHVRLVVVAVGDLLFCCSITIVASVACMRVSVCVCFFIVSLLCLCCYRN